MIRYCARDDIKPYYVGIYLKVKMSYFSSTIIFQMSFKNISITIYYIITCIVILPAYIIFNIYVRLYFRYNKPSKLQ